MRTEEAGQVLKSSFVAEVLTSNSPALTGFKVKEISQNNGDMKIRMLPQKGFEPPVLLQLSLLQTPITRAIIYHSKLLSELHHHQ